jgi:hypothetical protein
MGEQGPNVRWVRQIRQRFGEPLSCRTPKPRTAWAGTQAKQGLCSAGVAALQTSGQGGGGFCEHLYLALDILAHADWPFQLLFQNFRCLDGKGALSRVTFPVAITAVPPGVARAAILPLVAMPLPEAVMIVESERFLLILVTMQPKLQST